MKFQGRYELQSKNFIQVGSNVFLFGIVSTGLLDNEKKCDVNSFAIHTNVLMFKPWIEMF